MYLEVATNQDKPDEEQAKAAGIAEGYLTRCDLHSEMISKSLRGKER